jgi:CNT family concentrative nucleoside transporter
MCRAEIEVSMDFCWLSGTSAYSFPLSYYSGWSRVQTAGPADWCAQQHFSRRSSDHDIFCRVAPQQNSDLRGNAGVQQMHRIVPVFGLLVMILLAWLMSSERRRFPWRVVLGGTALQLVLAATILGTEQGKDIFSGIGDFFTRLLGFVDAGCSFVFGPNYANFYFAFRVLPTIIFFSSLMSILYHLGVMQFVVRMLSRVMQITLRTSGAESLSAAANIFVGQTEAPFVVLPYIARMTRSELMAVMIGGFATVAGGVLAVYIGFGIDAGHLVTASFISAPAGLLIAKVMQPETATPDTLGTTSSVMTRQTTNVIEAATAGAAEGLKLALNVAAMMIAFLALIAMVDFCLERSSVWLMQSFGQLNPQPWTLSRIFGILFAPLAWLMGIEWKDCSAAGELLGIKMVANELVAYQRMSEWMKGSAAISSFSPRSAVIMTYALCGFSNFASIGIQVGGIGGLAPERRAELAQLGFRAMLGGTLACCMTACVAAIVIE